MQELHDKMRQIGLARKRSLLSKRGGDLLSNSDVRELLNLTAAEFSSHLAADNLFGCELDGVEVYPGVQFRDGRLDPAVVALGHLMKHQPPLARVRYLLSTLPMGDKDGGFKERVAVIELLRQGHTRYVFDEVRLTFDIRE